MYDYLIVGSGLFGATFAHLANRDGKRCLVLDKRPQLGGNVYCEEIEGIHIKWEVVQPSLIIRYRAIRVTVKRDNSVYESPGFFVICMKDMGAILVYVDTFNLFTIDIPT